MYNYYNIMQLNGVMYSGYVIYYTAIIITL